MGKWGNGEMGKWENGKMGKWGNGKIEKNLHRLFFRRLFHTFAKMSGMKLESSRLNAKHFFPKSFSDAPMW